MTTDASSGKLDTIGKWSLIIGPVLAVIFNLLLPTNGFDPINPESSSEYIAELGADAGVAQVYMVLILIGVVLYTRAIIGLYRAAPEGAAKMRLGIGMMGAAAALSLWGVAIGLGLAEASTSEKVVDATAAGAAEAAASAGLVASAMHAAYFGVLQVATYVGYIALIPIGGGIAASGIVRKEFGWVISLLGLATIILTSIFPVKTEEGIMLFGILVLIWGIVFLAMGLQIARDDMS